MVTPYDQPVASLNFKKSCKTKNSSMSHEQMPSLELPSNWDKYIKIDQIKGVQSLEAKINQGTGLV